MRIYKDNIKIHFTTPFIEVVTTPYTDTKGKNRRWDWIRRIGNQEVVIIAATFGDTLVITKEYRVPIEGYEYGLPAGLIDKGETPEIAARRELKEETGLDIEKIDHISPLLYSSPGITNEAAYMVLCTAKGQISQGLNEASEDITTFLVSGHELLEMFLDKERMWGAKGYMLMQRFAMFGCLVPYEIGKNDNLFNDLK